METTSIRAATLFISTLFFAIAAFVAQADPASAQDDESYELHGFLLGSFAGRVTGERPAEGDGGDFLLAEERLRLNFRAWADSVDFSFRLRSDFMYDAITGEASVNLREAYIDYAVRDFDFRLGRQVATWGVGDLLFINDVFPKDWVSFFSGRPMEYFKIGVDGLRTRYSSDVVNAEVFIIPFFEPDNPPSPDRFFLFDPFGSVSARDEEKPDATIGNTELGFRLYGNIADFDVSTYVYRGFWRKPSMRPDSITDPGHLTAFYPDLSVYGASAQGNAMGGVLSFEAGYYDSRDDRGGEDPLVPNSQVSLLAGYQKQLRDDASLGIQYYAEIMKDHAAYQASLPAGMPVQRAYRDVVTLRLDRFLEHQTWKLSLMSFYGPADGDYLIEPQVSYKLSDVLSATLGANIFGGKHEWTSLGQFDRNDNIYLSVRYDF